MNRLKTKIVCVGKIKEEFLKIGINYYSDTIEIIEIPDEKAEENISEIEKELIKNREGEKILSKIGKKDYVINLDIGGLQLTTNQFKEKIKRIDYNYNNITFIIGGSLGLSNNVKKRGNLSISFSSMTFPHQLMRLVLVEQIKKIV